MGVVWFVAVRFLWVSGVCFGICRCVVCVVAFIFVLDESCLVFIVYVLVIAGVGLVLVIY